MIALAPTLTAPIPGGVAARVHVYGSFDFLTGYLTNHTDPIILAGKPWDNGSVNYTQYKQPGGGTSYWDYWSEGEPWNSPNHQWRDDQGQWHTYTTEIIRDSTGRNLTSFILVDRPGPGVMDKLWFTHDPVNVLLGIQAPDPPEVKEWGNLAKLGNLRIEVDGRILFDGPIQTWLSGDAQHLPQSLKDIFVWRYGQFGSDGNVIPIPYQNHLKISVYGGTGKPKWFMATGMTFPAQTHLDSYSGEPSDLTLETMTQLAQNVMRPENVINASPHQSYTLDAQPGAPAMIYLPGSGTADGIQFLVPKQYDPRQLRLSVQYGGDLGINLPLTAFFGEPDRISLHRSTPVGTVDTGDAYLFYSNWPMPFQNGMAISLVTTGSSPVQVTAQIATSAQVYDTQLRTLFKPSEKLAANGPDFTAHVDGDGKMVGLVLVTTDSRLDLVPRSYNPTTNQQDPAKSIWSMGYLEGNLTVSDGAGNSRYFSGQEDWAEGGYYFDSGFTLPRGGANRPFAGVLRYQPGPNGYATLFRYWSDLAAFPFHAGLYLSFGHGTYNNNFPVNYGLTLFYYSTVPGMPSAVLPASSFVTASTSASGTSDVPSTPVPAP
jgi:hypothetical protein